MKMRGGFRNFNENNWYNFPSIPPQKRTCFCPKIRRGGRVFFPLPSYIYRGDCYAKRVGLLQYCNVEGTTKSSSSSAEVEVEAAATATAN